MFELDGSETSWLVYADWLQDQDIDSSHIRQMVVDPIENNWYWQYGIDTNAVGSESHLDDYEHAESVGTQFNTTNRVGTYLQVDFTGNEFFVHDSSITDDVANGHYDV